MTLTGLSRMEQPCQTGPAVLRLSTSQIDAFRKLEASLRCSLCDELLADAETSDCQHSFCPGCISKQLSTNFGMCPVCRTPQTRSQVKPNAVIQECVQSVKRLRASLTRCGLLSDQGPMVAAVPLSAIEPTERLDMDDSQQHKSSQEEALIPLRTAAEAMDIPPTFVSPQMSTISSSLLPPTTQQIEEAMLTTESFQRRFEELTAARDTARKDVGGEVIDLKKKEKTHPPSKPFVLSAKKVFVVSSLSSSKRLKQLKNLIAKLGNSSLIEDFSFSSSTGMNPTHLVVGATLDVNSGVRRCSPTPKYFWALSAGCWVLDEQWLDECESKDWWAEEGQFNVYSYNSTFSPSRIPSRPMLFAGTTVVLGPFSKSSVVFTKAQCRALLELNGALVLDAGGEDDGSDVELSIMMRSTLVRVPNTQRVLLVGHPNELKHDNGKCSFCAKVYSQVKTAKLRLLESAWVMVCLETMCKQSLEEFELCEQ